MKITKTICDALGVDAQGRVDYRVNKNGKIYFLELNPNPNIAKDDDFASLRLEALRATAR